jgi:phosphate transport system permease protein
VGYEGYPRPAFVWQSSGASDEFEPKLSLVPLAFGTLKAACYALLFAVPLALLGALYTSQFAHPRVRARLKPTVEFMAALPTVVVGLVAGLWLAAFVERHLASVLLGMPFAVAAGTAGLLLWTWGVPHALRARATAGTELLVIVPMMLLGLAVAFAVGPWVESLWFGGDLRLWLNDLGFTYDQRNGLVVGLAMGFAVIPVIYTIAEDAFASVPRSLTAASAALGASRWQTAWRVVVPTAGAGVVSAVMVGFGRAVGETMIVLMVSGNSPLMDWSIFNGLRTLSATIAIEAPEAPAGGTLYRVLFLSAALLFVVTFAANTVAELLRQRLRDRYRAL